MTMFKRKIDWKRVAIASKNLFMSILRGEIVLKLDRFLPHIIVAIVLCIFCIWVNLKIDESLVEREKGRRELEQAKICYSQKVCQLAEMKQVNNVVSLLASEGVEVAMPEKPATIVKKK